MSSDPHCCSMNWEARESASSTASTFGRISRALTERSRRSGSGCESAGRKEKKSEKANERDARKMKGEVDTSRVPSAAIARQIYLCILRALRADRRNAAPLKHSQFSRLYTRV